MIPGTAVWFVAFVALLFAIPALREHDAMIWLWTALAGWLLGFVGLAIYGWQRAAARRGSRGASRMALEEQIGDAPSEKPLMTLFPSAASRRAEPLGARR